MDQKANQKEGSLLQAVVLVICGCLIYGIMQGIHDNYGIMMKALVPETGISYQNVSLCIGVGAFLYGFVQPVFGLLAIRKSSTFVMKIGIVLILAGMFMTPQCRSFPMMLLFFGIILPAGTGALSFGIVMAALTPMIGERRAGLFSGIIQSSAGVGDALMAPALQGLITWKGIAFSMGSFGLLMALTFPVILWLGFREKRLDIREKRQAETDDSGTLWQIAREGFASPTYRRVFLAFATCGFNMSIIESHLFSQYVSWGIPETASSLIMTIYGIMTMVGAIGTGYLGGKFKMKNVLGTVYGIRTLVSCAMLILPGSMPFAIIATGVLGMTGDSTVPPTVGLITREFGAKKLTILYGFALVAHQIGALMSSSFGGYCRDHFGTFAPLWVVNVCLTAAAAFSSYSVNEVRVSERRLIHG